MTRKKFIVLSYTYLIAAVIALACYAAVNNPRLGIYGSDSKYGYQRAFEETVNSVGDMSRALEKGLYATDAQMCAKLCAEVYADSLAATAAMSALPFSTQEISETSRFVGTVGDYAYTLCPTAAAQGFSEEERDNLLQLSETASKLAKSLSDLRDEVYSGDVLLDDPAKKASSGTDAALLSARLLDGEANFTFPELRYDGKYGAAKSETAVSEKNPSELREAAAGFLNCDVSELEPQYRYEDGRICFSCGEKNVVVGDTGVSSITCSRLVSECRMTLEDARGIAEDFLKAQGYDNMEQSRAQQSGCIALFEYNCADGDAHCIDNIVRLAVALDDGSIYAYDTHDLDLKQDLGGLEWTVTEEEAREKCPSELTLSGIRKTVMKSAGKHDTACYELNCTAQDGREVIIYIDAVSGRQTEILIK